MWLALQPSTRRPRPKGNVLRRGTRRFWPRVWVIFIHLSDTPLKLITAWVRASVSSLLPLPSRRPDRRL